MMGELEGVGESGEFVSMLPVGVLMAAAPNGWLYLDQLGYSRNFDEYLLPIIDVANRQIHPAAVRTAEAAIGKLAQSSPAARYIHHEFFSGLLLPSLPRVAEKTGFAQTAVDTAVLTCALERYRLAHGRFPDSLEKLTPAFIAKLPHDVINGKPLTYLLDPDGHYRLYSIGWNEKDDGGLIKQTKNGEVEKTEGDWVWANNF
jgi:hypothetical protein